MHINKICTCIHINNTVFVYDYDYFKDISLLSPAMNNIYLAICIIICMKVYSLLIIINSVVVENYSGNCVMCPCRK